MKKNSLLVMLPLMLLACTASASDFISEHLAWNLGYWPSDNTLSWTIDESDVTSYLGLSEVYNAIEASFLTWDNVFDTTYQFDYLPDAGGSYDPVDSASWNYSFANIVIGGWLNSSTWAAIGGNTNNIAGTWAFTIRDTNNQRVDFDANGYWDLAQVVIFFNDSYLWSTTGDSDRYDLQTVATHEIGHALGLHHSSDPLAVMANTTDPGEVLHELAASDIEAIQGIYPTAAPVPEPSSMLLFAGGIIYFWRNRHRKNA